MGGYVSYFHKRKQEILKKCGAERVTKPPLVYFNAILVTFLITQCNNQIKKSITNTGYHFLFYITIASNKLMATVVA
jgi:hypothetical protein